MMKYADGLMYMEGVIVGLDGGSVSINFKGRLGFMRLPLRMVIAEKPLKIGQVAAFKMSCLEIKEEEG